MKGSLIWAWPSLVPFLGPGFGPEIGFFFGTEGQELFLGLARSSSFLGLHHMFGEALGERVPFSR
jgi:hypothetical protein